MRMIVSSAILIYLLLVLPISCSLLSRERIFTDAEDDHDISADFPNKNYKNGTVTGSARDNAGDDHDENAARYRHRHHYEGNEWRETTSTLNALLQSLSSSAYDGRFRPHFGGAPVTVYCSVYVSSVTALSEENMDFTVDLYLLQSWVDDRIGWASDEDEIVNIADENIKIVWQPDTYIINAKQGRFHEVTKANTFLEIDPHGHIQQSSRITITLFCNMDFREFPFDSQKCSMQMEAYSQPVDDVNYVWLMHRHDDETSTPFDEYSHAASFAQGAALVHYIMNGFRIYSTFAISHDGYNHSRLVIDMYFSRKVGFYMIQIYLPACLMTVSSWISFWLPRHSAPARVTLSVTINLAMVTLRFQELNLPRVSYLKALDVYLLFCFVMVFLSLVEYAVVSYTAESIRKSKLRQYRSQMRADDNNDVLTFDNGDDSDDTSSDEWGGFSTDNNKRTDEDESSSFLGGFETSSSCYFHAERMTPRTPESPLYLMWIGIAAASDDWRAAIPGKIESIARITFPLVFIIFNLVYWSYYFYLNDDYNSAEYIEEQQIIKVD